MRKKNRLFWPSVALACLILGAGAGHAVIDDNAIEARGYYEDALQRFKEGAYTEAIIQLKNELQSNSDNLSAIILLGQAYHRSNNLVLAEQELKKALALGADPNLVLTDLLQSQLKQAKFDIVIAHPDIDGSLITRRKRAELYVYIGTAASRQQQWLDAEAAMEKAVELAPTDTETLLARTQLKFNMGRLDEAKAQSAQLIKIAPNSVGVLGLQARIDHISGDTGKALAHYNKALQITPNNIELITAKAQLLLSLSRYEEALELLEPIYSAENFDAEISYSYALTLTRLGRTRDAKLVLSDANTSLSSYEEKTFVANPVLRFLGAMIAYQSKDYEAALKHGLAALEYFPHNNSLRMVLAEVFLKLDDFSSALKVLKPIVTSSQKDASFLALYGHVLLLNENVEKAGEVLEAASKLAPNLSVIHADLGLAKLASGESDIAINSLKRAMDTESGVGRGGFLLAFYHYQRGEFDTGQALLKQLLERSPGNPLALNLLASIFIATGNFEEARRTLNQLLQAIPDFSLGILNYAKLEAITGDIEKATLRVQAALDASPQHIGFMAGLANLAELSGNQNEAITWLEKIRSIDSRQSAYTERLITKYIQTGNPDKAVQIAEELTEIHPDKFSAMIALATAQIAAGKQSLARSTLRNTFRISNLEAQELVTLAQMQIEAADQTGALLSLHDCVNTYADYVPAMIALARLEATMENPDRAFEIVDEIAKVSTDKSLPVELRGEIYAAKGDLDNALIAFHKAMAIRPDPKLALTISGVLTAKGRLADAQALLEQWHEKYPELTPITNRLAAVYLKSGQADKARSLYLLLLDNYPNEATFHNNLAIAYLSLDDERAIESSSTALSLAPENPSILDTHGWVLAKNDRAEEGLKYLREAYSRSSANPSFVYHLASSLEMLARYGEALTILEPLMERGINFPEQAAVNQLFASLKSR